MREQRGTRKASSACPSSASSASHLNRSAFQKAEGVWRPDQVDPSLALLFLNLEVEFTHPGPMMLWAKVMLGVVTVIEPKPGYE